MALKTRTEHDRVGNWVIYEERLTDGSPVYSVADAENADLAEIKAVNLQAAFDIANCLHENAA